MVFKNWMMVSLCFLIGSFFSASALQGEDTKKEEKTSESSIDGVAYVDQAYVLENVAAGKKAKKSLEDEFNRRSKAAQDEEASLRKATADLEKQRNVLNKDARAKKEQDLQTKIMDFQQRAAKTQQELQEKERDLVMPILTRVRQIAEQLRVKKKLRYVYNKATLIAAEPSADLTQEVIKLYDTSYPEKE